MPVCKSVQQLLACERDRSACAEEMYRGAERCRGLGHGMASPDPAGQGILDFRAQSVRAMQILFTFASPDRILPQDGEVREVLETWTLRLLASWEE